MAALLGPKAATVAGRRGTGLISVGLLDPTAWQALHDARHHAIHATPCDPDSHTDSYVVTTAIGRRRGAAAFLHGPSRLL